MLKRRNLQNVETTYLSFKFPQPLYEFLRFQAFKEKKTISLLIEEVLSDYMEKEAADHVATGTK